MENHRYICKDCKKTFNNTPINVKRSESKLVRVLRAYCPKCGSFNIDFTEHGKLLMDRHKKLTKLNQLNKN